MFSHITISKDVHDTLIEPNVKIVEDDIKMLLPCSYFKENSCSIYENKPDRCTSYSCSLLDKVIDGSILMSEAKNIANTTKNQANWLLENIPNILKDCNLDSSTSLRVSLYDIYILFNERLKSENYTFEKFEYQFCLNALDYLKGLIKYFHDSSLLHKYNNIVQKISK